MLFKSRARERGMADRDVADDLCFKPRQPPWSYTTAKKGGINKDVCLCVCVCVCVFTGGRGEMEGGGGSVSTGHCPCVDGHPSLK